MLFINYFSRLANTRNINGTFIPGGGTYRSLGFIFICLSGITTGNAMALGYQQVSLTLLLLITSNPAHLFILQGMPIWESRGSVYG